MLSKKCTECNKIKPITKFYFEKRGKYNKRSKCIKCFLFLTRKYAEEYKETRNKKLKKRRANDIPFKLSEILRSRLYKVIVGKVKQGSSVRDLGCSIEFLKKYLESKFKPKMSWKNYGKWHIDHILPLSEFDLTNRKQFLQACNYKNLQPLWAKENIAKHNKTIFSAKKK